MRRRRCSRPPRSSSTRWAEGEATARCARWKAWRRLRRQALQFRQSTLAALALWRAFPLAGKQDARIALAFVARPCWSCSSSWPCRSSGTSPLSSRTCASSSWQDLNFFSTDVSLENYRRVTAGDFLVAVAADVRLLDRRHDGRPAARHVGRARGAPGVPGPAGRGILLLFPYVVPVVAAALLWRTMLNPGSTASSTRWLKGLGGKPANFLLQSDGELLVGAAGVHRRGAVRGLARASRSRSCSSSPGSRRCPRSSARRRSWTAPRRSNGSAT